MPDDKAWYALRYVLWACGCRIALSKTTSFREASMASWVLFENALSVFTEILFSRASMMGVQALILMVRRVSAERSVEALVLTCLTGILQRRCG
jgi:hypothetical protein